MAEPAAQDDAAPPPGLRQELGALALLLGALLLAFGPALLAGQALAPADGLGAYLPFRLAAASAWLAGEWPSWNPFQFGGLPLLGALQAGALFPGNLPFLILRPAAAMDLAVLLAYAGALAGAYGLARSLGLRPGPAAFAALPFGLGGWMVGHVEHLSLLQAAACWPWLLWALHRQALGGGAWALRAGAMALAAMVLAGHPQTALLGLAYALAWALWLGPAPGWRWPGWLLRGAGLGAWGLALAAPQWVPALGAIARSQRVGLSYVALAEHALPWKALPAAWAPLAFGSPGDPWGLGPLPYWGPGPFGGELCGHLGLAAIALVALAPLAWARLGWGRFWLLAGAVAGLLALGPATPLHPLLSQLPGFGGLRVPARHLMALALAGGLLAGWALQALLEGRWGPRARAWGAAWAALPPWALLGALAWGGQALALRWAPFAPAGVDLAQALRPGAWPFLGPALLGLATAGALALAGRRPRAAGLLLSSALALDLLAFAWLEGWAFVAPPAAALPLAPPPPPPVGRWLGWPDASYPYLDAPAALALPAPGLAIAQGRSEALGYDPLVPARHARLLGEANHAGLPTRPERLFHPQAPLLAFLGVAELRLGAGRARAWGPRLASAGWRPEPPGPGHARRFVREAFPSAWLVPHAAWLEEGALAAHLAGQPPRPWRPTGWVLLEAAELREAPEEAPAERPAAPDERGPAAPLAVEALPRGLGRLAFRTQGPGWLVISEAHDPGWQAELNGAPARLWRAHGMLMALRLPPGLAELRLQHRPLGGPWPGLLALVALAALAWPRGRGA